jgi:hypothetical protein
MIFRPSLGSVNYLKGNLFPFARHHQVIPLFNLRVGKQLAVAGQKTREQAKADPASNTL